MKLQKSTEEAKPNLSFFCLGEGMEEKPLKVFKVSAEELGYETLKCGGCLWRTSAFYVLAESKEEALELIQKGEAGLCGDCFGELLADLSEKGYQFHKP